MCVALPCTSTVNSLTRYDVQAHLQLSPSAVVAVFFRLLIHDLSPNGKVVSRPWRYVFNERYLDSLNTPRISRARR